MGTPVQLVPNIPNKSAQVRFTPFERWGSVGLLFAASMINYVDRGSLSVALPMISVDLGLSPTIQGTLLSGFFWSYSLMQMPVGWAVDRFNAKWIYAGAFALWSVACGLTGFARSLLSLALARIVLGIGESAYFPSSTKIVSQIFDPHEMKGAFPPVFLNVARALGSLSVRQAPRSSLTNSAGKSCSW